MTCNIGIHLSLSLSEVLLLRPHYMDEVHQIKTSQASIADANTNIFSNAIKLFYV